MDIHGVKHPLGIVHGSAENATVVPRLLTYQRDCGLDVTTPILAVLDRSMALRWAIIEVIHQPVTVRCQLHKIRNVKDHLPKRLDHA